jgi:phage tail sheath protein FI
MKVEGVPATLVTPGIYREEVVRRSPPALRTGVPAFLGFTTDGRGADPISVSRRADAMRALGGSATRAGGRATGEAGASALAGALEGFFVNGGRACWIVPLERSDPPERAVEVGLDALERMEGAVDLICAPDVVPPAGTEARGSKAEVDRALRLQEAILLRCGPRTGWFAILDALAGSSPDDVLTQRSRLRSPDGSLYYPWIRIASPSADPGTMLVPPCGHVAGVFARVDRTAGVHKAPANEVLEGVVDLERPVTDDIQGRLNPVGVNCLRSFPARGIRVWGARTLSGQPEWRHLNVRRLVLTVARRLERDLASITFEPHGPELWARVRGQVAECLTEYFRGGSLRGRTPREAFYVKCDAETNPPESRADGKIVTEVGLAPNGPLEFIVVHLVQDARGVSLQEPPGPG